ncbi:MAG: hypothetical protein ABJQ68_04670 [Nonlabens ulvanivorans]|uniref:hypothetical protein n=1 Tax=Nonlabens ulvanivorans TaxID=906888 RepID=UPI00326390B3
MKRNLFSLLLLGSLIFTSCGSEIPIEYLDVSPDQNTYTETILENEIKGIHVKHIALTGEHHLEDQSQDGFKYIYLFVKGNGTVNAANKDYDIVPETILLPNAVSSITVNTTVSDTLHYLKISSKLTDQDLMDLKEFPVENTQQVYYAKFTDCKSYTEPIKSPNTVSRTILPNQYIPRIAMGTVQTTGPDRLGAHEHPMLEQLFLGLSDNNCTVYADDAQVDFPEYSVLHIPLGSSHSVSVEQDELMYYVWMDFFRDKKGEEWLKTHNQDEDEE